MEPEIVAKLTRGLRRHYTTETHLIADIIELNFIGRRAQPGQIIIPFVVSPLSPRSRPTFPITASSTVPNNVPAGHGPGDRASNHSPEPAVRMRNKAPVSYQQSVSGISYMSDVAPGSSSMPPGVALSQSYPSNVSPRPTRMSAGGPTPISRMKAMDNCCDCIATQNRCSSDMCACFVAKRICNERCESVKYRGDCLNQAICKCSCEPPPETDRGSASTISARSKPLCSKLDKCECLRLRESCTTLCRCMQNCRNKEVKKPVRQVKPKSGCTCAKSRRQCLKKDCPCRIAFEFCGPSCKCNSECTNSQQKFLIPKHIQQCFLEPKNESSGLVVTLMGEDYLYRTEFYHDTKSEPHVEEQFIASMYELISKYKIDIHDLVIYVSKSPCFHQDCDPRCEVIDECTSNKACSKLLGLLLSKIRKELGKVDVRVTVKFLFPHLHRGDLYTKQGILSMMQSGIVIEPLLMKDWGTLMDWCPATEHKGDYLKLWNEQNLDKAVAQSQGFINECRRAMGLPMKFWVAEIHEIVKNTIISYTEIRGKLGELNEGLKQLDLTATPSKIRSTPSKRRSFLDIMELRERIHFRHDKPKNGSANSLPIEDSNVQQMVASFCGRSFDDAETNEIAQRIRRATLNVNLEIESLMEYLHQKGNLLGTVPSFKST